MINKIFNTNLRDWKDHREAIEAALDSGYLCMIWNGTLYALTYTDLSYDMLDTGIQADEIPGWCND